MVIVILRLLKKVVAIFTMNNNKLHPTPVSSFQFAKSRFGKPKELYTNVNHDFAKVILSLMVEEYKKSYPIKQNS